MMELLQKFRPCDESLCEMPSVCLVSLLWFRQVGGWLKVKSSSSSSLRRSHKLCTLKVKAKANSTRKAIFSLNQTGKFFVIESSGDLKKLSTFLSSPLGELNGKLF